MVLDMQKMKYFIFITTKISVCLQVYDKDAVLITVSPSIAPFPLLLHSLLSIELFDELITHSVSVMQIHMFADLYMFIIHLSIRSISNCLKCRRG